MFSFALRSFEDAKPLPMPIDSEQSRIGFALRRLVDLDLATCWRFLRPRLGTLKGDVLEIGPADTLYRDYLPPLARHVGITLAATRNARDTAPRGPMFDGRRIPFADKSFDHLICTDMLEHVENPDALVAEMLRVLRPNGTLQVTAPFAARIHQAPHDFNRFTAYRLRQMFAGFRLVEIHARGSDLTVIASKLAALCWRLVTPSATLPLRLPLLVLAAPLAALFLVIAHTALLFGWGSKADPLGYAITAVRR